MISEKELEDRVESAPEIDYLKFIETYERACKHFRFPQAEMYITIKKYNRFLRLAENAFKRRS
tara:strand:+ start:288 stop:476 length:189 start_codon:yes stop_codon:yes gene_type:complete